MRPPILTLLFAALALAAVSSAQKVGYTTKVSTSTSSSTSTTSSTSTSSSSSTTSSTSSTDLEPETRQVAGDTNTGWTSSDSAGSALCIETTVGGWPAALASDGSEISCSPPGSVCTLGGLCIGREAWGAALGAIGSEAEAEAEATINAAFDAVAMMDPTPTAPSESLLETTSQPRQQLGQLSIEDLQSIGAVPPGTAVCVMLLAPFNALVNQGTVVLCSRPGFVCDGLSDSVCLEVPNSTVPVITSDTSSTSSTTSTSISSTSTSTSTTTSTSTSTSTDLDSTTSSTAEISSTSTAEPEDGIRRHGMGGTDETGFGAAENSSVANDDNSDVVVVIGIVIGGMVLVVALIVANKKRTQRPRDVQKVAHRRRDGNQPRKGTREYLALKAANAVKTPKLKFKIKTEKKFNPIYGRLSSAGTSQSYASQARMPVVLSEGHSNPNRFGQRDVSENGDVMWDHEDVKNWQLPDASSMLGGTDAIGASSLCGEDC